MAELRKAQLGPIKQVSPANVSSLANKIANASNVLLGREQEDADRAVAQAAVEQQLALNDNRFESGEGEILFEIASTEDLGRIGRRYQQTFEDAARKVAADDIGTQAQAEINRMHNDFITNPERDSKAFAADALRVTQAVEDQFSALGLRDSETATSVMSMLNSQVNSSYQKIVIMQNNLELRHMKSKALDNADKRENNLYKYGIDIANDILVNGGDIMQIKDKYLPQIDFEVSRLQEDEARTLLPVGFSVNKRDGFLLEASKQIKDHFQDQPNGWDKILEFQEEIINKGNWFDKPRTQHLEMKKEDLDSTFKLFDNRLNELWAHMTSGKRGTITQGPNSPTPETMLSIQGHGNALIALAEKMGKKDKADEYRRKLRELNKVHSGVAVYRSGNFSQVKGYQPPNLEKGGWAGWSSKADSTLTLMGEKYEDALADTRPGGLFETAMIPGGNWYRGTGHKALVEVTPADDPAVVLTTGDKGAVVIGNWSRKYDDITSRVATWVDPNMDEAGHALLVQRASRYTEKSWNDLSVSEKAQIAESVGTSLVAEEMARDSLAIWETTKRRAQGSKDLEERASVFIPPPSEMQAWSKKMTELARNDPAGYNRMAETMIDFIGLVSTSSTGDAILDALDSAAEKGGIKHGSALRVALNLDKGFQNTFITAYSQGREPLSKGEQAILTEESEDKLITQMVGQIGGDLQITVQELGAALGYDKPTDAYDHLEMVFRGIWRQQQRITAGERNDFFSMDENAQELALGRTQSQMQALLNDLGTKLVRIGGKPMLMTTDATANPDVQSDLTDALEELNTRTNDFVALGGGIQNTVFRQEGDILYLVDTVKTPGSKGFYVTYEEPNAERDKRFAELFDTGAISTHSDGSGRVMFKLNSSNWREEQDLEERLRAREFENTRFQARP